MDKVALADKIESSILNRVRGLLTLIPNSLTQHNAYMFETICDRICKIISQAHTEAAALKCSDVCSGWRRCLVLYYNGRMIGALSTWHEVICNILSHDCTAVSVDRDNRIPSIKFKNLFNKDHFDVVLETDRTSLDILLSNDGEMKSYQD